MIYLPSLLKKIDNFNHWAEALIQIKKTAQSTDPELYLKAVQVINDLSNEKNNFKYEDVTNELALIADLYRKSVEIKGGYNQVQTYLKRAMANIDMLIDESDGAMGDDVRDISDEILEDLSADLRNRAKSSPSQNETKAIQELKNVKNNFNSQEAQQEMESQKSVYDTGFTGDTTEADKISGYSFNRNITESNRYVKELDNLKERFNQEQNPENKKNLFNLMQLVESLINKTKALKTAQDELKIVPDDKELFNKINQLTASIISLRQERRTAKYKVNKTLLAGDEINLQKQIDLSQNPQEKNWLIEQLNLLRLRNNDKIVRKRDLIKALKTKVNSMGIIDPHGNFQSTNVSPDTMEKLNNAIISGGEKTSTKIEYDRKQTEERAKAHGKVGLIPEREKGRVGGGREGEKLHQYNVDKATFIGLIDKLKEKINTSAHVARLNVTQEINTEKKKVHNELKPYVDKVSKAIQKKDSAAKLAAIKELKQKMTEWTTKATAIKGLTRNVKWLPYFNNMKNDLETIAHWKTDEGWNLNENKLQFILTAIKGGQEIINSYNKYYVNKSNSQVDISFDNTTKYLKIVLDQLIKEMSIYNESKT